MISAGSVGVRVVPSAATFAKDMAAQILPKVRSIGVDIGKNLAESIGQGLGNPLAAPLDESSREQSRKAPKQGDQVAGAFAKGFEARLKAAFKALPKAEITADSSNADLKIAQLRAELEKLSGKTIGVDIDETVALAELQAIRLDLEQLALDSPSVQVKVDVAAALAQLEAVQTEVDHLDHDDVNIKVDSKVGAAIAGLTAVGASMATVATGAAALAAIPIGATLGASVLSLIGPLGAAGLGFAGLAAVAVPAMSNVTKAVQAQQQAQQAANGTAAQAAAANKKLAATMAALTPAERSLFTAWTGLRSAFSNWSRELQPEVLPIFTRGINLVKQALPGLTPIVKGAADSVGGLLTKVSDTARSPFWQQLRKNVTALVPTAITSFGTAAGNVGTGLAGVVSAFLPYAPAILSFITRIASGFARWGQSLGTSSGFASFIAYVKANLPLVLRTLTGLGQAIVHIVTSLAPLGPAVLGGFGLLLRFVSFLKPGEIQALAIGFAILSTSIWAVNLALEANPIVLVITGIVALIAAVILAYNHVGWFHAAVVGAFNGIKAVVLFVWNSILKPTFSALVTVVTAIGTAVMWLWRNVISPAFAGISLAARILFAIVAVAVIAPLVIAFNVLKAVILAWWHLAVVPAFAAVRLVISAAWAVIRPVLSAIGVAFRAVGSAATWLWHVAIVPALHGIAAVLTAVYNATLRPVFSAISSVIRNVVAPAFRWLWHNVIVPVWNGIKSVISGVWHNGIEPVFNALKHGLQLVQDAFSKVVSGVGKIWKGIEAATKKPAQFVVDVVYNNGIRSVWNKVAGLVHLPELGVVKFAAGGIFPGYTPGRDPYAMPMAAFSGGEAVMRPEFTRAVGSGFVHQANKVAASGGVGGVRDFLAGGQYATGGIVARYAGGGILGALKGAAGLVVHGASHLLDAGASAFAKGILDPILARVPGADSTFAQALYSMPKRMIEGFIGWLKSAVDPKLGGDSAGVVAAAKKYIGRGDDRGRDNDNIFTRMWGYGAGTPWCALFASTAIKDAHAGKHYPGYPTAAVAGYAGAMRKVPISQGRAGDLATYNNRGHINIIEKPGGSGFWTIGGNQNSLVQRGLRYPGEVLRPNFALGGVMTPGMIRQVFQYEAPRNADKHEMQTPLVQLLSNVSPVAGAKLYETITKKQIQLSGAGLYDDGGWLPPGPSLVYNGTGSPEPVLSGQQWDAMAGGRAGNTTEYHAHFDGLTQAAYQTQTRQAFHAMSVQDGTKNRVGRRR